MRALCTWTNYKELFSRPGNELCGNGVGTSVSAHQYASDVAALRYIVENAYRGIEPKPLVIAPGGFFDANWFKEFVTISGKSVDVVTHHIYNLGPGISSTKQDISYYIFFFLVI